MNQILPATLGALAAAAALLYLAVLMPRLRRSSDPWAARPLWRYFDNLRSYRDLSERDGAGKGPLWAALILTGAALSLGLILASIHFRDLLDGWLMRAPGPS